MNAKQVMRASIATLLFAFYVPNAIAQTPSCTQLIPAGTPITISASGVYCLTGDLVMPSTFTSGQAINIFASHVVLDLNGHHVNGLAADINATSAAGIYVASSKNVTVRNGRVSGFNVGVWALTSTENGVIVEQIRAYKNKTNGINTTGPGVILRDNIIDSTRVGVTCPVGGAAIQVNAGDGATVSNNSIVDTGPCGGAGIYVHGISALVENNRVQNPTYRPDSIGIAIYGEALVVNNRLQNLWRGIFIYSGTIKYRDNLTIGVTYPYYGGGDAGNNN
jgi:hypothetical protein